MKNTTINIRATEEQRLMARDTARQGGWRSVADMVMALIAQAQSQQHQPQTEQSQRDPLRE